MLSAAAFPGAASSGPDDRRTATTVASTLKDGRYAAHNVGLLTLQVTNFGVLGNPWIDRLSAGWRGGEYLYSAGLWVGALGGDGDPHVSTTGYDQNADNRDLIEFRAPLDFRSVIYEAYEGIPGGLRRNPSRPERADDDGDGLVDEDFLDGFDDDGDGLVDEDYAAIGQQMLACTYRDDTPEARDQLPNHRPLGLLVRQRSFQWALAGINEFVGLDFEIVNAGDQRLRDVALGFFSDTDAGPRSATLAYFEDDLMGWDRMDTTLVDPDDTGFCSETRIRQESVFTWDAPDVGGIAGGDVSGVVGVALFDHTVNGGGVAAPATVGMRSLHWFGGRDGTPAPRNDVERYALLTSTRFPPPRARAPANYKSLLAVGLFPRLDPGESVRLDLALVVG